MDERGEAENCQCGIRSWNQALTDCKASAPRPAGCTSRPAAALPPHTLITR